MVQLAASPREKARVGKTVRASAAAAPEAPLRWRRRKDARPVEILSAALAEFVDRGFSATRLDQVAARAGVSKGTLYLYFDSKAALFKAVVRATILPNLAQAEAAARDFPGPSGALLSTIIGQLAANMATSDVGAVVKLVVAEAGNFPDIAKFYYDEVISRGLRLIGGIIVRGVARGEFRAVDVDDTARLVMAPVLFAAVWRHSFEVPSGAPLDIKKFIGHHVETLLRGIAPTQPGGSGA